MARFRARWSRLAIVVLKYAGPVWFVALAASIAQTNEVVPSEHVVRVGDGTINGARLLPYDNAFVITRIFKDGHVDQPGIWTDHLRLREVDGRKAFVRSQSLTYEDGTSLVSINVFDPITLAPISDFQRTSTGRVEKWTVNGRHVEGDLASGKPGDVQEVKIFDTEVAAYDLNCCMRSLIPAALPLRNDYSATLPAIPMTSDDPATAITYKVVGRDRIKVRTQGFVDAWIVETLQHSVQFGDVDIRFWLSEKPPFVLRMTLSDGTTGKLGYSRSFDLLN